MNTKQETVSIVGVDSNTVLQFEHGATHIIKNLRGAMTLVEKAELAYESDNTVELRDALGTAIDRAASLILEDGRRDFNRLQEQGTRIAQWSLFGDKTFHDLPWELLCNADQRWLRNAPIVRRRLGHREFRSVESEDDELRILFLTARPSVLDVPPRAVIEPLLRRMESGNMTHPRISVLRTGTFEDMEERLQHQRNADAPAHIVHLDLHGTIIVDGGDKKPVLMFERPPKLEKGNEWIGGRKVTPHELAEVLLAAGVQVLVLNACRSASGDGGANFAFHLAKHDVPAVVGIRRRISVPAASRFVAEFYQKLCTTPTAVMPVTDAIRQARSITARLHPLESTYPSLFITRTPSLPLRPATKAEYERKLRKVAIAESFRPRNSPVGRALDERVIRAKVFGQRSGREDEHGEMNSRLEPLQLVGWRGVGKTAFTKSLVAHWVDADLADNVLWHDLRKPRYKALFARAGVDEDDGDEDINSLVTELIEGGGPFDKSESNIIVVDHAEELQNKRLGRALWHTLTSFGTQDNAVIVVGRHIEWARKHVQGRSRRFTMCGLDDHAASQMLRRTQAGTHAAQLLELCGGVPAVLDLSRSHADREALTSALDLADVDDVAAHTLAAGLVEELFTPRSDSYGFDELARFAWLADAYWLSSDDLDDLMPNKWRHLLADGLITEVPLQSNGSYYLPHPLLPWLGAVATDGGEDPGEEAPASARDNAEKRTYWGEAILT